MSVNKNNATELGYTREQYTQQIAAMLPPGKAFNRQEGSNLWNMLYSYAGQIKQVDDTGINLTSDWFPSTTTNFLEEWQNSLGLPDKCVSNSSSLTDQRNQVVMRLSIRGDCTIAFVQSVCDSMGYEVEIKEWGQIICGVQACGTASCGTADRKYEGWLTINILNGLSPALLYCELNQYTPPYLNFAIFSNGSLYWNN